MLRLTGRHCDVLNDSEIHSLCILNHPKICFYRILYLICKQNSQIIAMKKTCSSKNWIKSVALDLFIYIFCLNFPLTFALKHVFWIMENKHNWKVAVAQKNMKLDSHTVGILQCTRQRKIFLLLTDEANGLQWIN